MHVYTQRCAVGCFLIIGLIIVCGFMGMVTQGGF